MKNYYDEEKRRRLSIVALHVNPLELLFRLFPFKIIFLIMLFISHTANEIKKGKIGIRKYHSFGKYRYKIK